MAKPSESPIPSAAAQNAADCQRPGQSRVLADYDGLSQIISGSPVATIVLDSEHRVTHWNRACTAISGFPPEKMLGTRNAWMAFYPSQRPIMADLIIDGVMDREGESYYRGKFRPSALIDGAYEAEDFFPHLGEDGLWLFFTAAPIRTKDGRTVGAVETLQDVTERKRAQLALQENQAVLAQIIDGSSVAAFVIDREHRITHWNRACEVLTSVPARDVVGTRNQWRAFYPEERPVMADLMVDGTLADLVDRFYHGKYKPSDLIPGAFEAEDFFPDFGHDGKWVYFTAAPLHDRSGEIIGAIETLQDVTARRRAEIELRTSEERYRLLSVTDGLTGLFNSRHFHETLQTEVSRAQRYGRQLSLLIIDADNFKRINDSWGHLEGDKVLQILGQTISKCLRRSDTAYRYGGEEFAVIMPEAGLDMALRVAERLRRRFAAIPLDPAPDVVVHCTVSIGAAELLSGDDFRSLIRRADQAAYAAKKNGKNCVVAAH